MAFPRRMRLLLSGRDVQEESLDANLEFTEDDILVSIDLSNNPRLEGTPKLHAFITNRLRECTSINLSKTKISEATIAQIAVALTQKNLLHLAELRLAHVEGLGTGTGETLLKSLGSVGAQLTLTVVDVSHTSIGVHAKELLEALGKCPSLTHIDLSHCGLKSNSTEEMLKDWPFGNAIALDLSGNQACFGNMNWSSSPNLQSLKLRAVHLSVDSAETVHQLGLSPPECCPSLNHIDLSGTTLAGNAVASLQAWLVARSPGSVETLAVANCSIPAADATLLLTAAVGKISSCLDFSDNELPAPHAFQNIAQGLLSIRKLCFDGCGISAEHIEELTRAKYERNSHEPLRLRTLSLVRNELSAEAIAWLAELLSFEAIQYLTIGEEAASLQPQDLIPIEKGLALLAKRRILKECIIVGATMKSIALNPLLPEPLCTVVPMDASFSRAEKALPFAQPSTVSAPGVARKFGRKK